MSSLSDRLAEFAVDRFFSGRWIASRAAVCGSQRNLCRSFSLRPHRGCLAQSRDGRGYRGRRRGLASQEQGCRGRTLWLRFGEFPELQSSFEADALAEIPTRYHVQTAMTDSPENRLIEALRKVDAHGDVAPAHVQDPMSMVLRQRAIQADLIRWDDSRGHYVLTGTGRSRITTRNRTSGVVIRFRKRDDRDVSAPHRKAD